MGKFCPLSFLPGAQPLQLYWLNKPKEKAKGFPLGDCPNSISPGLPDNRSMPTPKALDAYPPVFAQACAKVLADGPLVIPADNPLALRLQFYGYLRALRAAGRSELASAFYLTLTSDGKGLKIAMRDTMPAAQALSAVLGESPNKLFD